MHTLTWGVFRPLLLAVPVLMGACASQPVALKAGSDPTGERGARLLSSRLAATNFDLICPEKGGDCWVPVVIKTRPDPNGAGCKAGWLFLTVTTWKNTKVVWYLNEYEYDGGTFEFGEVGGTGNKRGIDITFNGGPTGDFDSPGHVNTKKHLYSWKSKNTGSNLDQDYEINVFFVKGGKVYSCGMVDPYIVNKG